MLYNLNMSFIKNKYSKENILKEEIELVNNTSKKIFNINLINDSNDIIDDEDLLKINIEILESRLKNMEGLKAENLKLRLNKHKQKLEEIENVRRKEQHNQN